ncbi:MAG: hypothetical protein DCC49_09115 [Acidobacteria bacterium]|nr:MAG: hypothetical protein DCC49_09115 [Acidobacteriota bacterium]
MLACLSFLALPTPLGSAKAAGPGARPAIELVAQPLALAPNQETALRIHIDEAGLSDLTDTALTISFAPQVESRAAVSAIAEGRDSPRFRPSASIPISQLETVGDSQYVLRFKPIFGALGSVGAAGEPPDRTIAFPGDGVYPAQFELRKVSESRSPALASTSTWFAFVGRPTESPLHVALSVSLGTQSPGRDGLGNPTEEFLSEIESGGRLSRAASVAASSPVPLSLEVVPETISDLVVVANSPSLPAPRREDAARVLGDLTTMSRRSRNELISTPYARPPSSVYADRDFDAYLDKQVELGATVASQVLGTSPTAEVAVLPPGSVDGDVVERVVDYGAVRLVVGEEHLGPLPQARQNTHPAQPFLLAGTEAPVTAIASDSGLSGLLANADNADPRAQATRILAEIAATYFEAPGVKRSLVISASPGWEPSAAPLSHLLSGLASLPVATTATLGKVFDEVPLATGARRAPLLRETSGNKPPPVPASSAFAAAHRILSGYESILVEPNALPGELNERILAAQGAGPLGNGGEGARQILDAVIDRLERELGLIRIPPSSGITLTSRDGVVPVRIDNETGYPVRIALWLESEHVSFPDHVDGDAFTLVPPGETKDIKVVAGATGAFTIRARLASPNGELAIADSRLPVRSTGASSASLLIAAGAGGFLLLWWIRELRKGWRAREGLASDDE